MNTRQISSTMIVLQEISSEIRRMAENVGIRNENGDVLCDCLQGQVGTLNQNVVDVENQLIVTTRVLDQRLERIETAITDQTAVMARQNEISEQILEVLKQNKRKFDEV